MAETLFKCRTNEFASCQVLTPTAGYTAGQMVAVGSLIGIIVRTKVAGEQAVLVYRAEKIYVPKVSGALTVGAKVYFVTATSNVTSSAGGNTLCGRVVEAAASGDAGVLIDLTGNVVA